MFDKNKNNDGKLSEKQLKTLEKQAQKSPAAMVELADLLFDGIRVEKDEIGRLSCLQSLPRWARVPRNMNWGLITVQIT